MDKPQSNVFLQFTFSKCGHVNQQDNPTEAWGEEAPGLLGKNWRERRLTPGSENRLLLLEEGVPRSGCSRGTHQRLS